MLDEPTYERLVALSKSKDAPFSTRILLAGLDPAHDLQHADFKGVNLTGSDLRGFNFAHADLSGAMGQEVRWDNSTNLRGARVANSMFALREGQRRYFEANPDAVRRLTALRRQSDTEKINWTADHVKQGSRNQAFDLPLAQALYLEAEGGFLKSQLLFFMSPALAPQDLKEFALGVLTERPDSAAIMRSVMDMLSLRRQTEDRQLRSAVLALVKSINPDVRDSALRWLVQHPLKPMEFELVRPILEADERLAGIYVAAVAARHGEVHEIAVRDPMNNRVFSLKAEVPMSTLLRIALRWTEAERSDQSRGGHLVNQPYSRERHIRPDRLRRERANAILHCWADLRQDHIDIWLAGHRDN
jgi:uncharacterized protein YjbI with pentapeptide repeats